MDERTLIKCGAPPSESAAAKRTFDTCGLVDQFEGELDLARGAGSFADNAEAAAEDGVGGKAKINDVEDVEKFSAKFKIRQLALPSMTNRRVLDESHVDLMKTGTAKGVASQGAEETGVWTGASREIDRNVEKGAVVGPAAKIILAHGAAGGKIGHGHEIGAVRSASARAGLLNPRVDGERRAAGQGSNIKKLPTASQISA